MKKYEITNETIHVCGKTLYRIKSLIDFGDVTQGTLGGFIEKETNLSHGNDAWVYDDAKVYDNAMIYGNAKVYDFCYISDEAQVSNDAVVYGDASVYGGALVGDQAKVHGNVYIYGNARIAGTAQVYGNANISGGTKIVGDADVCGHADYITFKNFWSSGRYFTWTRSNNMWSVGCFYGTGDELIKEAYNDSEKSGREYERVVRYVESILEDEKKGGEG